jgi:metal-responsive CopG/Arc/MetJ family transcriptional regulator
MKVSITLPDELFDAAETLVRRTGRTRSEFYRRALEYYVAQHDLDRVREACENDFINASAGRVLEKSEW